MLGEAHYCCAHLCPRSHKPGDAVPGGEWACMRHAAGTAHRPDLGPLDSGADSAETPLTAEVGEGLRTAECSSALLREPSVPSSFPALHQEMLYAPRRLSLWQGVQSDFFVEIDWVLPAMRLRSGCCSNRGRRQGRLGLAPDNPSYPTYALQIKYVHVPRYPASCHEPQQPTAPPESLAQALQGVWCSVTSARAVGPPLPPRGCSGQNAYKPLELEQDTFPELARLVSV